MDNNIRIYGELNVEVDCEECGVPETVEVSVDESGWLNGFDIEARIDQGEIKAALIERGWEEVNGKFVCADCADELKSNNDYEE